LDNQKEAQDGHSSEFTLADVKNSQINLDDVRNHAIVSCVGIANVLTIF
jgi:hypothetical protein